MTNSGQAVAVGSVMEATGVAFGTSGARGRVIDLTDRACYTITAGFLRYLEVSGELAPGDRVAVGGDLRESTARIAGAVARAVRDRGLALVNCGSVPSPALALYGIREGIPTIMVTGSHIPDDRNGIKYNRASGEILKEDEAGIRAQEVHVPDLFDGDGNFRSPESLPPPAGAAGELYVRRYLDAFPRDCLRGLRLGLYEHSSVARDLLYRVLTGLGAEVTRLARSATFLPVDTEAVREEDVRLARQWAAEQAFDAVLSADGDGDRPLVSDEAGNWLRGDVAGIVTAAYLGAEVLAIPVSCNTAAERCGRFREVRRTRIGSPYVIAEMERALADGAGAVVGYEANGGFLTATPLRTESGLLDPLPTRDAAIVILAVLLSAQHRGCPVSELVSDLPRRFTASGRLREFPTQRSQMKIADLIAAGPPGIEAAFGSRFGTVREMDTTDGLRVVFETGEIVHLRPSGNAPEFRCYTEADSEGRAGSLLEECLECMESWRS